MSALEKRARWRWFAAGLGCALVLMVLLGIFLAYRLPGLAGALVGVSYCG